MKGGKGGANRTMELAPGRAIVGDKRYTGCVQEWTPNGYGWIVPLEAVSHPAARKRNGRIYVEQRDVRGAECLQVGTNVDFILYADVRGLGASDVELAAEDPADTCPQDGGSELPLPAGWEQIWSEEHGEFYYWHQASKESSWEHPAGEHQRHADEGDDPSLPANWENHYDEENEDWYYWNRVTKESSWERPTQAIGGKGHQRTQGQEKQVIAKKKLLTPGGVDTQSTRVRGRVTNWQTIYGWMVPIGQVSVATRCLIDNHGGKIFLNWRDAPGIDIKVGTELDFEVYVDSEKGACAADVRQASAKNSAAKGRGGKKGKGKGAEDPLASLEWQWAKQDKKLGVTPAPASGGKKRAAEEMQEDNEEQQPSVDGPLMPGWEQHWSEEHNCYYYWHKATNQSAWDRPSMPLDSNEDYDAHVPGMAKKTAKSATPMTPLQSGAGGCSMTPITALPRNQLEKKLAQQPPAAPHQRQYQAHGNRPIVPVWQQQSGKRGRY